MMWRIRPNQMLIPHYKNCLHFSICCGHSALHKHKSQPLHVTKHISHDVHIDFVRITRYHRHIMCPLGIYHLLGHLFELTAPIKVVSRGSASISLPKTHSTTQNISGETLVGTFVKSKVAYIALNKIEQLPYA